MIPGEADLRARVRAFLAGESFVPRCDAWLSGHDPAFSRRLAEHGLVGMTIPTAYGGGGCSALDRYVVTEELLVAGAPVAAHWMADRQTAPLLLRYGTEEQRQRFLPGIARAECLFAIGMSESQAGSDLAAIRTVATPVEGGYLVRGRKVWTSHAQRSHFMVTLCRTEESDDRHGGMSQLIVDLTAPGVEVSPVRLLGGEAHFNEVALDDVFVPDNDLIGRPGAGWEQVMSELGYERSGPERLLSTFPLLAELARTTPPAAGDALCALGHAVAGLAALRQLSLGVAGALAAGEIPVVEAALVKDVGTRLEGKIVELARLYGADGSDGPPTPQRSLLSQAVLAAPGFTLRGGATEILRGIVARGLGVR